MLYSFCIKCYIHVIFIKSLYSCFWIQVLAHELGHNFGMYHDFDEKHGGSTGPCNGQGIMSYGSYDYNQWSTCSKADFEEHYAAGNWGNGCLEDISGIIFV